MQLYDLWAAQPTSGYGTSLSFTGRFTPVAGFDMRGLYWNNVHMSVLVVTARPSTATS